MKLSAERIPKGKEQPMRLDLLDVLQKHLRTVAPETFEMRRWWCGTAGCEIGHAGSLPDFQGALGLVKYNYHERLWPKRPGKEFFERDCFNTVALALELENKDTDFLFDAKQYPLERRNDPVYVADRIKAFVDQHRPKQTVIVNK